VKLLSTSTWRQGAKIASIASAGVAASVSPDSVWEQASDHYGRLTADWVTGGFQRHGDAVTA
jgi:hypothetical protein